MVDRVDPLRGVAPHEELATVARLGPGQPDHPCHRALRQYVPADAANVSQPLVVGSPTEGPGVSRREVVRTLKTYELRSLD